MPTHNPSGQPPFIPVNVPVVPNILIGKAGAGLPSGYAGVQFVSGDFGSDAFDGLTVNTPLKNLDTAYNRCIGGANEVVCVLGGTAAVTYSPKVASGGSGLVWSKNYTHLVGLASNGASGLRARITNGVTTVLYTPLLQVSGNGCLFKNIELFNGGADTTAAAVCLLVTGNYNTFDNCQISGGGNATNATNAACRSLVITGNGSGGGGENTFLHCYIGLSTVERNTTSTEIEFTAATPRNVFEDCTIITWTSSTGTLLVKIGAGGIQSSLVFRRCLFIGNNVQGGAATPAQALSINAAPGGVIATSRCLVEGCTKVETTASAHMYAESATALLGVLNTA